MPRHSWNNCQRLLYGTLRQAMERDNARLPQVMERDDAFEKRVKPKDSQRQHPRDARSRLPTEASSCGVAVAGSPVSQVGPETLARKESTSAKVIRQRRNLYAARQEDAAADEEVEPSQGSDGSRPEVEVTPRKESHYASH